MPDRQSCKVQLREKLRRWRRELLPAVQQSAAERVTQHITRLPNWSKASRIALYLANDGEVDTMPLRALCHGAGRQLFLPVIAANKQLSFAKWAIDAKLTANRYGIPEPHNQAPRCATADLDIIVLPLVAWDRQGGRLGMGGGYYDRTLAGVRGPLLVGLSHAQQEVPRLPRDDWDIPLDFVVTENALHQCGVDRSGGHSVLDDDAGL